MLIDYELNKLNSMLAGVFDVNESSLFKELNCILSVKSKRLRPSLIFLFAKALSLEIDSKVYALACAAELSHNAAIVHDDIIDNSEKRRGRISLNAQFGTGISVLAGDMLLSAALKKLAETQSSETAAIFADCFYKMTLGEIMQKTSLFKLPSMEEYIKKSEYKTAELFKASISALFTAFNLPHKTEAEEFARFFGAAFQIKDDLLNITGLENGKPALNDIKNGIYTAPVLFLNEDAPILDTPPEKIIELVKNKKYIEKTVLLIKEYADRAVSMLDFLPDNIYKKEIAAAAQRLYEADING